jgi:hypothetical protein
MRTRLDCVSTRACSFASVQGGVSTKYDALVIIMFIIITMRTASDIASAGAFSHARKEELGFMFIISIMDARSDREDILFYFTTI